MSIPIFQVDAFTAKPFAGNPSAVCLLKEEGEADWMQSVAAEMNLSETAFLTPQKDGFGLRVVHAENRGGSLRPRHSRQCACALENRPMPGQIATIFARSALSVRGYQII